MRSKKEIMKKPMTDFLEAGDRTTELTPVSKAFDWVLEGEPRYSSIELEKLVSYYANLCPSKEASAVESFGKFLQDKTRVEKILK